MKKITLPVALYCIIVSMASCGSGDNSKQSSATTNQPQVPVTPKDTSRDALIQAIRASERKLKDLKTFDAATYTMAMNAYADYARYYPADTASVGFLFLEASYASGIGQFDKALKTYQFIEAKYPQSKNIPDCMLGEAEIYNNNLKDTANAHKKFSEIIEKFPGTHQAQDSKMEIKYLGMTPDQLGKMFEEQNKAKEKKEGNKKTRT
jgi:TolA-binding protein